MIRSYIKKKVDEAVNKKVNDAVLIDEIEERVHYRIKWIAERISNEALDDLAKKAIDNAIKRQDWDITCALNKYLDRGDIVQVLVKKINDSQIRATGND